MEDLEYYGDWCLSYQYDRDTLQDFFQTVEAMLDRLVELTQDEFYDIHVMKFNTKFGYEVINTFLKEE